MQIRGEAIEIGRRFEKLGYTIYATRSTAKALNDAGVKARKVNKINQESPTVMDLILGHKIDLVIDTSTQSRDKSRDGFPHQKNFHRDWSKLFNSNGYSQGTGNQLGEQERQSTDISKYCRDIIKPFRCNKRRVLLCGKNMENVCSK